MQLVVVGTGLMGGSFALAARQARLFERIIGMDPDAACARRALELGILDAVAESVPEHADAILLSGPSHTIGPWVARLAPLWERSSAWERSPDREQPPVIFDTASVKAPILEEIRTTLGAIPARFVPCHPLAGSEQSGPEAADETLFRNAELIMTPTPDTDPTAIDQVQSWWRAIGARVITMSAGEHDRVLAVTSHLPHLLAFAYLHLVDERDREHTAGGFRDFTRIGASDAEMWAPILRLNRSGVLTALDRMEGELERVRKLIEDADEAGLVEYLRAAARRRGGVR